MDNGQLTIKSTIRKRLIQRRTQLTQQQYAHISKQICDQILSHNVFMHNQSIALYSAFGHEVDLTTLTDLTLNKAFYLPVIGKNNSLVFRQYLSNKDLSKNKYGILEPTSGEVIESSEIDLCLVPLVGFNRTGDRLGMGGGYYDRYFQFNKEQKKPTILAGVAYDFQENATIQAESWDIPLDIIFTNNEVIIP